MSVVLPLAIGAIAGSLDIPRNDDWSYRGIATRLFASGRLELDGAAQTAVLGQVLLTQPLLWLSSGAPWAFLAAGTLFSLLAVVTGYLLFRRILEWRSATLCIGLLLIFPAYLAYAISYMSDVPAVACQFGCLGLASVAISRQPVSGRWLLAALVVGCIGFSIREFALAAPAAVVAALVLREPTRPRTWLTVVGVGLACAAILVSRFLLPGQLGSVPWELKPLQTLLLPLATASLVLSPVSVIAAMRWRGLWRKRDVLTGIVLGGVGAIALVRIGLFPHVLTFGLVTQWGAPHPLSLMGDRPELFSDAAWSAIGAVALISIVLTAGTTAGIAGAHLRRAFGQGRQLRYRLSSTPGLLVIFVVLVTGGLAAFCLVGAFYDRYLWPLIPPLAALFLYLPPDQFAKRAALDRGRRGRNLVSVGGGVAAFLFLGLVGTMSAAFMLNSNAYDAARWRAGETLVGLGHPAAMTDAGAEWVHSHQTGFATVTRPSDGIMWYHRQWPSFRLCAFAADSDPMTPGESLIKVERNAYQLYLFLGPTEPLFLYRVDSPGCP